MSAPSASSAPVPAPTTGDQSPSAFLAQPRQELEDLLNRKALVDDQIANIERQIYYLEGSYLEETATQGNVLRGFDGYLTARAAGVDKKKGRFKETERLFSLSSSTYQKVWIVPFWVCEGPRIWLLILARKPFGLIFFPRPVLSSILVAAGARGGTGGVYIHYSE